MWLPFQSTIIEILSNIPGCEPEPPELPVVCHQALGLDNDTLRQEVNFACAEQLEDQYFDSGHRSSLNLSRQILINLVDEGNNPDIRTRSLNLWVDSVGDLGGVSKLVSLSLNSKNEDVRELASQHINRIRDCLPTEFGIDPFYLGEKVREMREYLGLIVFLNI